jgi:hypothetical protein
MSCSFPTKIFNKNECLTLYPLCYAPCNDWNEQNNQEMESKLSQPMQPLLHKKFQDHNQSRHIIEVL